MSTSAARTGRRARRTAVYAVAVLGMIGFFNTVDATVLPAVLPKIQRDFHLGDSEVGLLTAAFTVALALGAIPIGIWADRGSRRVVIGLGVGVWSFFTLLTGLTQNFLQLLAIRSVVGIGEASYQPTGFALLSDHFGKRSRGRAIAAVMTVASLGIGGGFIIGGVLGQHFGWRAAFFVAGGPGLLLALLVSTMREPVRGAAESAGPRRAPTGEAGLRTVVGLLRIRTFATTVAAAALAQFGFALLNFLPLYLSRRFGLSLTQAGALVGVPQLLSVIIVGPTVGFLIDWRARRTARAAVEVGVGGLLLTAASAVVMFSAPSVPIYAAAYLVFALTAGVAVFAPIVIVQNVIAPSLRASAGSINLTISRVAGSALSPIVVGVVSDAMHGNLGLSMLALGPAAFALAAGCLAMSSMARDVEAMEASWAAAATAAPSIDPGDHAGDESFAVAGVSAR
jgi:MFS transporter, Spinster family, sphingosine-1-phosphate transporter